MEEVWLSIPDYEGLYQASNLGKIRRLDTKKILSPVKSGDYWYVSLSKNGIAKTYKVHVLVLKSFCGKKPFEGAHAAHNDGDTSNNLLINLRWATPKENQIDIDRHGRRCRGEAIHCSVLKEGEVWKIREMIKSGKRNRPIAEAFGVSISTIHLIRHNKIWKHLT